MGMLYRGCACLLGVLPVDNAGRRVFDETLADWRREGRTASGMLAVARSVLLVSWREVISAPMGTMTLRIVGWSALWVVLGLVVGRYVWGAPSGELGVGAYAAFAAVAAVFFLPAAVLRTWQRPARYAGFTVALVVLLYQTQIEAFIAPDWILWMFVSTWVPVMMLAGLVAIGSRSADKGSSPTPTSFLLVGR